MIRVISTLVRQTTLLGYRIFVVDGKLAQTLTHNYGIQFKGNIADLSEAQLIRVVEQFGSVNILLGGGKVTLTDGALNSLPQVNPVTGECVRNNVMIVLEELTYNDEVVGYTVCNYTGRKAQIRKEELIKRNTKFANAKIVTRGSTTFISPIKGVFASFPLKLKASPTSRVVVRQETNYATLVSTTRKYGACSINARANTRNMVGVVSLSEDSQVIFRTKNEFGDIRTYVIPQGAFNTTFTLDDIVLPSNEFMQSSVNVPKTQKTNAQVLKEHHERGVKAVPVSEVREGKPTGLKGYLRFANGQYQFQQLLSATEKRVVVVDEGYVNTNLYLHTKRSSKETPSIQPIQSTQAVQTR